MIVFEQDNGLIAVCSKVSSVPSGALWAEVDTLPDRKYRSAWRIVDGAVVVDSDAAATIDADEEFKNSADGQIQAALDANPALKAIFEELESQMPNLRANARARM